MVKTQVYKLTEYALVFDLDGVIVDTAKYHYQAWKRMAAEVGIDLTEEDNEKLKGVSRRESMDLILSWGKVDLEEEKKRALMFQKNEWYKELIASMKADEILPGVEHFLREIEEAGMKKALASASKNAVTVLQAVGLSDYFDSIVDGNNCTRSKPDPEVFLSAASLLNIAPTKTIVFEDAIAGVEAANAAGAISIGVGDKNSLNMADHVISGFHNIDLNYMSDLLNSFKNQ